MRVVFSLHAYAPSIGGAERYAQGLAEGLAHLGHEVHVVVANIDDPEAFYELGHEVVGPAEEMIGGVQVHRVPYGNFAYRQMGRILGAERVIGSSTREFLSHFSARIADLDPDVVVTLPHLFPNVEGTIRLKADARWRLVYVPMLHEDDPYWSIERVAAAVSQSDYVLALTEHERDRLLESYGAKGATTAVVPPGVESGEGTPYADREAVVLFVGRRTASKRLDILYEAMRIVWEKFPDVVLQLAGSSPGVGADPAIWISADSRVKVINTPTEAEKDRLLGSARVVVSPSLTESFGITTLEAWAQGTPVVVADSPVNRSVVRQGLDGLVAAGASALDLGNAIVRVLDDAHLAEAMGRAAQIRAQTDFTWDSSAQDLEGLLQTVS